MHAEIGVSAGRVDVRNVPGRDRHLERVQLFRPPVSRNDLAKAQQRLGSLLEVRIPAVPAVPAWVARRYAAGECPQITIGGCGAGPAVDAR